MDERVATALCEAFPSRSIDRTFGVGPSWNGANETVGVAFADGERAFCKVATDGDGTRTARELAVLRYLDAERSVAGPAVLAGDPAASVPYLVTEPAPGDELLGVWEDAGETRRETLLRRVGATLATLHADRFEAHGEIVGSDAAGGLALERAPWPDVLRATIERTREIGTSERLAAHYDAVFDCVEAARDRLEGTQAARRHGDVTRGLHKRQRVTTRSDCVAPVDGASDGSEERAKGVRSEGRGRLVAQPRTVYRSLHPLFRIDRHEPEVVGRSVVSATGRHDAVIASVDRCARTHTQNRASSSSRRSSTESPFIDSSTSRW